MEQRPIEVFIDSSVLFAASDSPTGASREIIRYGLRQQIRLVVNQFVLEETRKNLFNKRPVALSSFEVIQQVVPFRIINPTRAEVLAMQPYTALKDAPHLATALKAKVYCLISLDRKHMIEMRDRIEKELSLRILLPAEFLEEIRRMGF